MRKAKNNADPTSIRFRALHKLLRQIVALEEKQKSGVVLNEAQIVKLNRFDEVVAELEDIQRVLDKEDEGGDQSESEGDGAEDNQSESEGGDSEDDADAE